MLPWADGTTRWAIEGVQPANKRWGIRVSIFPVTSSPFDMPPATKGVWLPSSMSTPPVEELPALVKYLIATPAARDSLADSARCRALVAAMARKDWQLPRPPNRPLMGDRLDNFVAVNRALDSLGWRRFERRPVHGEWRPASATVSSQARVLLACEVAERVSSEELARAVKRHVDVGEWPFDVLVD